MKLNLDKFTTDEINVLIYTICLRFFEQVNQLTKPYSINKNGIDSSNFNTDMVTLDNNIIVSNLLALLPNGSKDKNIENIVKMLTNAHISVVKPKKNQPHGYWFTYLKGMDYLNIIGVKENLLDITRLLTRIINYTCRYSDDLIDKEANNDSSMIEEFKIAHSVGKEKSCNNKFALSRIDQILQGLANYLTVEYNIPISIVIETLDSGNNILASNPVKLIRYGNNANWVNLVTLTFLTNGDIEFDDGTSVNTIGDIDEFVYSINQTLAKAYVVDRLENYAIKNPNLKSPALSFMDNH